MTDGTLIWLDNNRLLLINTMGEGTEITVDEAQRLGYKLPDKNMIAAADDSNRMGRTHATSVEEADNIIRSLEEKKAEMALKSRLKHHSSAARSEALARAKAEFDSIAKARDEGEGDKKPKTKPSGGPSKKVSKLTATSDSEVTKKLVATPKKATAKETIRPKWQPSKAYQTLDWHAGLLEQENFLPQKKRLMLYRTVKTSFSVREALKGFYGSMLELTYALDDYYWAMRTKGDIKRNKAGVWDMLREYNLDEKSLDGLVRQTNQAFENAVKEFNIWNDLMFFTKLDKVAVSELINFISDGEQIAWLRSEIEAELSALDVDIPPKNIGWFFRRWHIVNAK